MTNGQSSCFRCATRTVARLPVYVKKEKSTMAVSPAEVEKLLKGVDFPARKADLIKHVKQEMQQVLDVLQKLPDETYNKPTDVARAFGEIESRSKSSR